MDNPDLVTILLVDDESSVRRGLRMQLELEPDMRVVGEACDGEDAIALALQLRPSLVLMDLRMPGMDGVQATGALYAAAPEIPVVLLSLQDDSATRARATAAGARAFVSKHERMTELLATIRDAGKPSRTSAV